MNCIVCGEVITKGRKNKRFCSKACYRKYRRPLDAMRQKAFMKIWKKRPGNLDKYRGWIRKGQKIFRSKPGIKERQKLQHYAWRKKNPLRWKELKERDRLKHPIRVKMAHLKRKHNMREAGILPPAKTIQRRMNLFRGCCYCGKKKDLTLEHLISINTGGTNEEHNIFGACKACNSSKQERDWREWFRKQPFYSQLREALILKYHEGVQNAKE